MVDQGAFIPEDWEIRQLKRQRALARAGIDEVHINLRTHQIVAKIDTRPENLDAPRSSLPPLTQPPGRV